MQTVTAFRDLDNQLHADEQACRAADNSITHRRNLLKEAAKVMAPLGARPGDTDFANGSGWVHHRVDTVLQVARDLRALSLRTEPGSSAQFSKADDSLFQIVNMGSFWTGRCNESSPLAGHWNRLVCICGDGREFGQPYFALNPHKATQVCLDDRR